MKHPESGSHEGFNPDELPLHPDVPAKESDRKFILHPSSQPDQLDKSR
jgi:hypothetical protein